GATQGAAIAAIQFLTALPANNTLPMTFSASGQLDGLTFNPATGILSGTPTAGGTFQFTISVSGGGCAPSSITYTLSVAAAAPACAAVAAAVTIQRFGWVKKGFSSTITQRVTLTNTGAGATGPLYYVLDGLTGATLQGAAGVTTCAAPMGSPYVLAVASLPAGASQTITLNFSDPGSKGITYNPRVLTGGTP
ncbi:MAG: putative Ig domain-containing protein, partial [Terriglobales bacterium]